MPHSKWSNLNLGMLFNSEKRQEIYVKCSTQGKGDVTLESFSRQWANKKYVHFGCVWLGNPDLDLEIWILDFAIKCEIIIIDYNVHTFVFYLCQHHVFTFVMHLGNQYHQKQESKI